MSIFERDQTGKFNSNGTLELDVVTAVANSPKLTKDNGLKHAGQSAALNIYHQVLVDAGVPQDDVDLNVDKVAQRLKEKPRKETIVFARTMCDVASSRRNGKEK